MYCDTLAADAVLVMESFGSELVLCLKETRADWDQYRFSTDLLW